MLKPAAPGWTGSYNKMVDTYVGESDRAAAVLGGSFVDVMLEDVLKASMVDDPKVAELFKGYSPLATSSAKTNIAHAIGLLPQNMRGDLDKIRRIRNHFAHHPDATSFDVAPARDICSTLSIVDPGSGVSIKSAMRMPPREQYLMTIAGLSIYFDRILTAFQAGHAARSAVPASL
jgi:hypothetical protein